MIMMGKSIRQIRVKFIADIYIHFYPEFYEKSGIRTKIEPEKH